MQDDSGPPSFRYLVKLPDGRTATLHADRIHRPGDRLVVMAATGRITGRVLLSPPYRRVPRQ
jgi:hypothetical protein